MIIVASAKGADPDPGSGGEYKLLMAINNNIHVKLDARVYKLMSAGSYKKALKLIENIIVDYPDDDKSFLARGHC